MESASKKNYLRCIEFQKNSAWYKSAAAEVSKSWLKDREMAKVAINFKGELTSMCNCHMPHALLCSYTYIYIVMDTWTY